MTLYLDVFVHRGLWELGRPCRRAEAAPGRTGVEGRCVPFPGRPELGFLVAWADWTALACENGEKS